MRRAITRRGATCGVLATATVLLLAALALTAGAAELSYPGVVVKVDHPNHSVVVKNPQTGSRLRFVVSDQTPVTLGGALKSVADLPPGTEVVVEYEIVGERYEARRIAIKTSGGG